MKVVVSTERLNAKFDRMTPQLTRALGRQMDLFAIDFRRYVQEVHLKGGNPLHQRSGKLIQSLTIENRDQAGAVIRKIYSANPAAVYGRVHEFGLTITRTIRKMFGKTLRNPREVTISYPERSFMRVSIPENYQNFRRAMDRAMKDGTK